MRSGSILAGIGTVAFATACGVRPEVVAFDSDDATAGGGMDTATGTAGQGTADVTGAETEATAAASVDDGGEGTSSGGLIYDVGAASGDTGGGSDCACGSQLGFSYIWIANSAESTVSKLNTQTLAEEGRYLTRPDAAGDPSRTSVSLSGLAVAVANRSGGVVKIWADPQLCDPMTNGVPGVQTSAGKDDVLPWGQDDCVAWYTPFDDTVSQRPIAWVAGVQDPVTCSYEDEAVWTARSGGDGVLAHLLDGEDGTVLASVPTGMGASWSGQYGGAVDSQGDFWITRNGIDFTQTPDLAVVDREDLTVTGYKFPPMEVAGYGITVDGEDRVWIACNGYDTVARFDPATETWATGTAGWTTFAGIVEGPQQRMWTGSTTGTLQWFDRETLAPGLSVELGDMIKGVSVDVDGYVWAVTMTTAFKIDPVGPAIVDQYEGLTGPYTYSDMTGWALQNASCEPAG